MSQPVSVSTAPPDRFDPTDRGAAKCLISENPYLKFDPTTKTWAEFNGQAWKITSVERVHECIYGLSELYAEAATGRNADKISKFSEQLQRNQQVKNVEQSARSLPEGQFKLSELDQAENLLNLENGTLDLRSFELLEHDPKLMQSKLAPVEFDPDAHCPQWMSFIDEFTCKDSQLAAFLQELLGTALLGANSDRVIGAFLGEGRNGKSVLLETMDTILGDYSQMAPPHLLGLKIDGGPSPEIARMRGVRQLILDDPNVPANAQRVAVDMLKRLSGDQTLTGRALHQGFIEFKGQMLLLIAWNKVPDLSGGGGEAIWDRLMTIPCNHRVKTPDTELKSKLWEERSGILNWLLTGLRRRNDRGRLVAWPNAVLQLQEEIRYRPPSYKKFASEMIVCAPGEKIGAQELFDIYVKWCSQRKRAHVSVQDFKQGLVDLGLTQVKRSSLYWIDVRLSEPI